MARGVMQLLQELHGEGATIVMVTHDQELAARAQREVHLVDGQILDLGARLGSQGAGALNVQPGA
jgi:putative ABC transport system ATP-binding protein